jgi:hypothetical protein
MMMPGLGGTIGALAYAQKNNPELFSGQNGQQGGMPSMADVIKGQMLLPNVKAQYMQQRINASDFNSLTPDAKNYALAQTNAMGIDPTEAVNMFNQGLKLSDIADKYGYGRDKSNWPDTSNSYFLTAGQRSQIQNRNASVAELNGIGPTLTQATAPYAQRIAGYSPNQIMDSIKQFSSEAGNDPDAQDKLAQFVAARAVMPEYNAIRLRATGVKNIGVEAMRDMGNASMNNFKAVQGLVTPQIYTKAQDYVDQWVNQMRDSANKVVANPYPKMQQAQSQSGAAQNSGSQNLSSSLNGMVQVQMPDGKTWSIPKDKLSTALQRGAKQL